MAKMNLKPGVLTGTAVQELFAYCKEVECALPAVNVIGSHSANAALQAAKEASSPIIIQVSSGGAQFYAGKFLDNSAYQASVHGGVAFAMHVRTMAEAYGVPVVLHTDHCAKKLLPWIDGLLDARGRTSSSTGAPVQSHMLDLSEEPLEENIAICKSTSSAWPRMGMTLEIELGVTGGEEDGVDNTDVDSSASTPSRRRCYAYEELHGSVAPSPSPRRSATSTASTSPATSSSSRTSSTTPRPTSRRSGDRDKPVDFVFHGGSGSSREEIGGHRLRRHQDEHRHRHPVGLLGRHPRYEADNHDYLQGQIGNPEGPDKPNKKKIDPRGWIHLGEKGVVTRLVQAFKDLNSFEQFEL
jgi:fructose-bisphosphate aldolase class II